MHRVYSLQATHEMMPLAALCIEARDRGIAAVRSTRDENTHTFGLYLDAAVSTHFLRSNGGQGQLRVADTHSRMLMEAATSHNDSETGNTACIGWTLIRKLAPALCDVCVSQLAHPAVAVVNNAVYQHVSRGRRAACAARLTHAPWCKTNTHEGRTIVQNFEGHLFPSWR